MEKRATRIVMIGLAVAAIGGSLGACGNTKTGGTSGQGHKPTAAAGGVFVATRKLSGIGTVLVDKSGKTVYSPQVAQPTCTRACLSFWFPVTVKPGTVLSKASGVHGALGTIHRSDDGLTQLTYDGKPLYTFRLDSAPGQARGDNFTDRFSGVSFTWRVVQIAGTPTRPASSPSSGGGYGGGY